MTEVIWHATVDNGTWLCEVTDAGDRQGILTVKRVKDDAEVLRKKVPLAYGAIFGPDVDDVQQWQEKSITAIDAAS